VFFTKITYGNISSEFTQMTSSEALSEPFNPLIQIRQEWKFGSFIHNDESYRR